MDFNYIFLRGRRASVMQKNLREFIFKVFVIMTNLIDLVFERTPVSLVTMFPTFVTDNIFVKECFLVLLWVRPLESYLEGLECL